MHDENHKNHAFDLKKRLRDDLKAAMKLRKKSEVDTLRSLIAAIDNGEAPLSRTEVKDPLRHDFFPASTEAERLELSQNDLNRILSAEIFERERAADEMEKEGMLTRALELRAEALIAKRYQS